MKIFIDVRLCSYGYQGVKVYIDHILKYLLSEKNNTYYLAGYKEYLKNYKDYSNVSLIEFEAPIHSIKEQVLGFQIRKRYKNDIDIYFFPYPAVPVAFYNTNFIVIFYDITPFRFWYFFNPIKVILGIFVTKIIAIKAKKIVTISEAAKKDLDKYFGLKYEKIKVIYCGVSHDFRILHRQVIEEFKKLENLKKYILFVGNREKTKNLFRLARAIEIVRNKGFEVDLLIIGRKYKAYEKTDKKLLSYGKWVKIFYNVENEDLVKYYNGCEIYVQPSLNEGFGLPVVEAMKCGCVCVVSDIAVFREILKDAGVYFNPYNVEDIAEKIIYVLKDDSLKETLRAKSIDYVKNFNWEFSTRKILELFYEIYEKRRRI